MRSRREPVLGPHDPKAIAAETYIAGDVHLIRPGHCCQVISQKRGIQAAKRHDLRGQPLHH